MPKTAPTAFQHLHQPGLLTRQVVLMDLWCWCQFLTLISVCLNRNRNWDLSEQTMFFQSLTVQILGIFMQLMPNSDSTICASTEIEIYQNRQCFFSLQLSRFWRACAHCRRSFLFLADRTEIWHGILLLYPIRLMVWCAMHSEILFCLSQLYRVGLWVSVPFPPAQTILAIPCWSLSSASHFYPPDTAH